MKDHYGHSIQDCPENELCDLAMQKLKGIQTDRIATNTSSMLWGKGDGWVPVKPVLTHQSLVPSLETPELTILDR